MHTLCQIKCLRVAFRRLLTFLFLARPGVGKTIKFLLSPRRFMVSRPYPPVTFHDGTIPHCSSSGLKTRHQTWRPCLWLHPFWGPCLLITHRRGHPSVSRLPLWGEMYCTCTSQLWHRYRDKKCLPLEYFYVFFSSRQIECDLHANAQRQFKI